MKKYFKLIVALFIATFSVMAEMTVYVYKKDGTKVEYLAANVDSIGFANVFTIAFDANGGSGNMNVIKIREGETITLPANTFTKGSSTFAGWNTQADGSGTAYADKSSVALVASLTLYAQWEAPKDTGIADGHEWVDLGLPSGTKWATMNVGADSPEDYGDYFAWGETATKSEYTCGEYKYYNIQCTAIYKYCALSSCFNDQEDNNTVLDLEDDVASANWGSDWRMPTKVEQEELSNTSYTVWTWITQNGVNGYKVTSKINGNSIFLPAAGSSGSYGAGSIGHYWSSSLYTATDKYAYERSFNAYYLHFNSSGVYNYSHYRYVGLSIRPVLKK